MTERSGDTPRQDFVELDLHNKAAWAHLSSVGSFKLNSLTLDETMQHANMLEKTSLSQMQNKGLPLEEIGPFMIDQQLEASSKGMMDVVFRTRTQADELDVQLFELSHAKVVSVLMQPS